MIGGSGNLGMGVAFTLYDNFSNTADRIDNKFGQLEDTAERASAKISAGLKTMFVGAGIVGAGAAVLSPFIANLERASDLQEGVTKSATIFGEEMKRVTAYVENQSNAYGQTRMQAYDAIGTYGNLFTAMKLGKSEAATYSIELTKLASDLASFNNTDVQSAIDALRSGMSGETEPLKKYGVALNSVTLSQKAMQMGIIKSAKEWTTAGLDDKMRVSYQLIMEQTKTAQGDFIRTGDGYANMSRKIEASIVNLKTSFGAVLLPVTERLSKGFQKVILWMDKFVKTPIGKTILHIAFAIGVALVVLGAMLLLIGALTFASGIYEKVLSKVAKTQFYTTYTSKGLRTALWELVAAEWAAIAPVALVVAGILLFVAAGYAAWKMIDSGNDKLQFFGTMIMFAFGGLGAIAALIMWLAKGSEIWGDKMNAALENDTLSAYLSGLNEMERTFAGIWGVISSVKEIWESWNGETFTLTEATEKKLRALGLLDFVLTLATYVIRFKEFLGGMWDGLVQGFGAVWEDLKDSFNMIWEAVKPLLDTLWNLFKPLLKSLGFDFGKLGGDVSTFREAGRITGLLLSSVFGALSTAIKIVAWAVSGLIELFTTYLLPVIVGIAMAFWAVGDAIVGGIIKGWNYLVQFWGFITALVMFLWGLPVLMLDIGVAIIRSLWEGMKAMWVQLKGWFEDSINWITNKITGAFGAVKEFFGMGGDEEDKTNPKGGGNPSPINNGASPKFPKTTSKTPAFAFGGGGGAGAGSYNPTNIFNIQMDGDDIAHKVDEKRELKKSRK